MNKPVNYPASVAIGNIIDAAQHIVIIQADNPDADSMASALALEQILSEQGKQVTLYCGVDITHYLRYIPGWDRVINEIPSQFDAAILVDCSSLLLLEQLEKTNQISALRTRPFIIIDHHDVKNDVTINATEIVDTDSVATSEVLYLLGQDLGWTIDQTAANLMATSILADSLGLTTDTTTARSIRVLSELVEKGAKLSEIDALRRAQSAKPIDIVTYKGQLLQRIEYFCDNQLAIVTIPWEEIEKYSPIYNPSVLALEELRMTEGVKLSIALKLYPDGKITGKLRCNYGARIAGQVAEHFGGGGHPGASGFKTKDWQLAPLKQELITITTKLLQEENNEAIQHPNA